MNWAIQPFGQLSWRGGPTPSQFEAVRYHQRHKQTLASAAVRAILSVGSAAVPRQTAWIRSGSWRRSTTTVLHVRNERRPRRTSSHDQRKGRTRRDRGQD